MAPILSSHRKRNGHAESSTAVSRRKALATQDPDSSDAEEDEPTVGATQTNAGGTSKSGIGSSNAAAYKKKEQLGPQIYKKMVTDMVKLALYYSYRRQPIKKDDINKKVLNNNNSLWPLVFEDTQKKLSRVFGMELVELRQKRPGEALKGAEDTLVNTQDNGKGKKRANDGEMGEEPSNKKKSVSGVKSWIVRSTLPPNLIALMNEPSPILPEAPDDDDLPAHSKRRIQKEVNRREAVDSGAILDWKKGDGAPGGGIAMKGILFALLAMILVRDRMIEHTVFLKHCREKLGLSSTTVLPYVSPECTTQTMTFEGLLTALCKQNYLEKNKIVSHVRSAELQGDQSFEWRWGARSEAEIGEKAVAEFILDIAADDAASDNEVEEEDAPEDLRRTAIRGNGRNRTAEQKRIDKRKKFKANVEKAAGGNLTGVTT